ncbi:MAG: AmmeMemoRadiSam system protein B [Treponema sp.]|nr:AmmeMemoRadiSam system protein B [Treponema sp.]
MEEKKAAHFPTWQERNLISPDTPEIPIEQNLAKNDVPFAGIVSHHLLAYKFIDEWFFELSGHNPKIKTFIVLSPSHWNLSRADFSMTSGAWNCDGTFLKTDKKIQKTLLEKLDGKNEDDVFLYEHGVSAIAPFIAKYFPKSKIVAIAYDAESPVNTKIANRLSVALEQFVAKKRFFHFNFFGFFASSRYRKNKAK